MVQESEKLNTRERVPSENLYMAQESEKLNIPRNSYHIRITSGYISLKKLSRGHHLSTENILNNTGLVRGSY